MRVHVRTTRLAVGALVAIVVVALMAACAPEADDDPAPGTPFDKSGVEVDTPELRKLRKSTKIAACKPGPGAHDGQESPGQEGLPAVTLPCLGGGQKVELSSLRGPMVINLWASWCKPCRKELPILEEFNQLYGDQVSILGIDYNDTQPEAALKLARSTGISYPVLADPDSELALKEPLPNIRGLPALIFMDKDGRIVDQDGNLRFIFEEINDLEELTDLVDEQLDMTL